MELCAASGSPTTSAAPAHIYPPIYFFPLSKLKTLAHHASLLHNTSTPPSSFFNPGKGRSRRCCLIREEGSAFGMLPHTEGGHGLGLHLICFKCSSGKSSSVASLTYSSVQWNCIYRSNRRTKKHWGKYWYLEDQPKTSQCLRCVPNAAVKINPVAFRLLPLLLFCVLRELKRRRGTV